jgi:endonuclease/exonuclease/phosphatase family metal-dependent hydrolase
MSLTLLQWNCMYSEDPRLIAAFIASVDPDIICLQELTDGYHDGLGKSGEWIANRLGYDHHCAYGPMVLPDGTQSLMGDGILSRLPMTQKNTTMLQEGVITDGKVTRDARMYLDVTIDADGHQLRIGTTHLPFHPRFQTTPMKSQMIGRIIGSIPAHGRYIMAGDLNTTPRTKAAKSLRQHGLKNGGPSLIEPTWTTKPFNIGPWSYESLQYRLDYVLHKSGVRAISARILSTELSDHLPILVKFDVR